MHKLVCEQQAVSSTGDVAETNGKAFCGVTETGNVWKIQEELYLPRSKALGSWKLKSLSSNLSKLNPSWGERDNHVKRPDVPAAHLAVGCPPRKAALRRGEKGPAGGD